MSEEKIDIKKLTVSKAIAMFLEGKFSKKELEDAFDIDDLFKKLSYKELEEVLYRQKKAPSSFPKELRIKSGDIVYQYGRNISAGVLMNLADKGYVTEADLLKALKKNTVLLALAAVSEKEKEDDDNKAKDNKEPKADETKKENNNSEEVVRAKKIPVIEIPKEEVDAVETHEEPLEFKEDDILDKETVKTFFSADKLIKMFFARKMTREFTEAYEDAFKDDKAYRDKSSKEMVKELQDIFSENLQALYIVIMRLHFRGMIFSQDIQDAIKAEFFTEKTFDVCDEYDVLDRDGNVIYSYKKDDKKKRRLESGLEQGLMLEEASSVEVPQVEETIDPEESDTVDYPVLEPITREEVLDAYRDNVLQGDIFKRIFTEEELLEMYKTKKVSVKVFTLLEEEKRKAEILKAYNEDFLHLEEIMELYFEYDGISVEDLKSIIKELPQKVAITRFIKFDTEFEKIYELYKNRLIDFSILYLLRCQEFITENEFEEIRTVVDKEEFYEDIESKMFYTRKTDEIDGTEQKVKVEISDTERVLLSKVMGISDEEIENISIINSKLENGEPTMLNGYHIISDKKDGLVIFGKFDYASPIYVMRYEEAAYYLRSRDGIHKSYIYEDLLFTELLENNNQVRVVEHDENMAKTIVQAMCELSEEARSRYIDDEQYMQEVLEYIKTIDENYVEMIKESNNNM